MSKFMSNDVLKPTLENDQEIEELEAGSAEYGLAIGLIAQKVIMDSINEEQYNSDK